MGRCFLLPIYALDETEARGVAEIACKQLLANLVMEHYEIASIKELQ